MTMKEVRSIPVVRTSNMDVFFRQEQIRNEREERTKRCR